MQGDFFGKFKDQIALQKDRLFLWVPVFQGIGIGFYFYIPFEPKIWVGALAFLLIVAWFIIWLRVPGSSQKLLYYCNLAVLLVAMGFCTAQLRSYSVDSPILQQKLAPAYFEGIIESIEPLEEGNSSRIILSSPVIEKLSAEQTPRKLRLKLRSDEGIMVGQRIKAIGELDPPSAPVIPGGFDFRRYLYYEQIGGVGFIYKAPEILEQSKNSWLQSIEGLRQNIGDKIIATLPPKQSAVALALMIGRKKALADDDMQAIRDSGLAHMLSISGLHITLLAGVLFFLSRFIMVLIPDFALKHPIKKYAAVFAMAGAVFYMFMAGSTAPTIRSVLMIGIVFLAIILDRSAISLRLIAFAGFIILLLQPENLISVSFQMSFAAVAALIAFFDGTRGFWSRISNEGTYIKKAIAYFCGVCATTVIATIATAPISIFHFQQFAFLGVVANLIAVPVLSFLIMPFIVMAFFMMPLGLGYYPMMVVGHGISFILQIAHACAGLPQAVMNFSSIPFATFILFMLCGLWVILWKGWGKLAGFLFILPALGLWSAQNLPDILVTESHKLVGVRGPDDRLYISTRRAEIFSQKNWNKYYGLGEETFLLPEEGVLDNFATCSPQGCHFTIRNRKIAWNKDPYEIKRDCMWAEIIIADDPVKDSNCKSMVVIDKFDSWTNGSYAVWVEENKIKVKSAKELSGDRPWSPHKLQKSNKQP